jgi:kumamolisin
MRRQGQLLAATAAVVVSLMTPLSVAAYVPRTLVAEGIDSSVTTRDVAPDTTVQFRIVLRPERQQALDALLVAQRNPRSPYFHRYLQPGEFAREFGPSQQTINNLVTYFSSFGVAVQYDGGGLLARAQGQVRNVEALLHTDIRRSTASGALLVARGAPTLPDYYAAHITVIIGLSRSVRAHHHLAVAPRTTSTPLSSCNGAEWASGLTGQEQAALYGIDQLWGTGSRGVGHTIALYELAQYRTSDLSSYFSCYGISPTLTNTTIDGGASGYDAEVALDIQQAGVLSPGATLAVYSAPNDNTGPVDLFAKIADDNTADIVSISWGICEAATDASAEAPIFQQMAAQGQTVIAAAGDAGSSDCQPVDGTHTLSVDDPASQPYVTAVGGTYVNSFDPFHERVWNDGAGSGGGGVSSVFTRPNWQSAPGMDNGTMREVPDVSLTADPRVGFPTYYNGHWATFGGTSIGAPILSSLLAVAAQSCATSRFGFINPMLYAMAQRGVGFRDVTDGSNDLFNTGSYAAASGYDMASGLGSPDPNTFAAALCPSQPSPITTTLTSTSSPVDLPASIDLALRDADGVLLATTVPVVSASQSGATPVVTVAPPVSSNTTQQIRIVSDRPGVVTINVAVGGVTVASSHVTITSPVTARNVTGAVGLLAASGTMRTSTLAGNVVIVGQRSNHQVVMISSNATTVRNLGTIAKAPLATATPDVDCWRAVCTLAYRANSKVFVITNAWSAKPKVLSLATAIGSTSQPRVAVLAEGSAVSYVSSSGRLVVAVVSDTGSLTRNYIVGSNVRGTSEVTRTTTGRLRVIARTTKGLSAFTNVAGTTLTTTTILSSTALTTGPFVVSANPETVVSMNGTQLLGPDGTQIATVSSTPVPLVGLGSGMMITIDAGIPTLWCSTPTWRPLDISSTLGVSLTTPSVSGSGGALLLTSSTATWAFTR